MKRLTIVPVVHYQKDLYNKLINVYKEVAPDAIALEYSNHKQVVGIRRQASVIKLGQLAGVLADSNIIGGQEATSALNYSEYYERTPIYCVDRFHLVGRAIIPVIKSGVPRKLKETLKTLTARFREWGIKNDLEKILGDYDNVLLVVGRAHAELIQEKFTASYVLRI